MKLYCLGKDAVNMAGTIFPNDTVVEGDLFDLFEQERNGQKIDRHNKIFTTDLVRFGRAAVLTAIKALHNALTRKGELYLTVPSIEWAFEEIMVKDQPSPLVWDAIYGRQRSEGELHLCGFTLADLRSILVSNGFVVLDAGSVLMKADGHPYKLHQVRCRRA